MKGGGFAARGAEKRAGGLPPGRCACGRSACEPRYGRAPFGRSPGARDFVSGLLTRRLILLRLQIKPLGSAKAANRHGEISTNPARDRSSSAERPKNGEACGMALAKSVLAVLAAMLVSAAWAQQGPMSEEMAWRLVELGPVVDLPNTAEIYAPLQENEPYQGVRI